MSRLSSVLNVLLNIDQDKDIIETEAHAGRVEVEPEGSILEFVRGRLTDDQFTLFQEELKLFQEEAQIEVPPNFLLGEDIYTRPKTERDFIYDPFTGREFRGGGKLSFDIIERMKRSGVVMFPLEMKRSQLMHVFRKPRKWKVVCENEELQKIATANLEQILPKMADEFTWSAMVYGTSFGEITAQLSNEDQLGLPITPGPKRFWTVFDVPRFIDPTTVKHIKRTGRGRFDGFVQLRRNQLVSTDGIVQHDINSGMDIDVPAERALVIPYQDKFGDLWGESFFKNLYPYWFWFEVVTRAMVRYMERMSTPVAIAKAPSRRKVRVPGTDKLQDAMLWALGVAKDIATSNAAVLPSEVDPQTNQPAWGISYLTAPERAQNFKDVLEMLQELIFRASNTGDRAFTQSSGGVGSFNQAEIHSEATTVHNEMLLIGFLWYLNTFFMPKYSLLNLGFNGPPIRLETVGLSSRERVLMSKLLATAGNSAVVQEFFHIIDWRTLAEDEGIPTFTAEEIEENKRRLLNEQIASERRRQTLINRLQQNQQASGDPPKGGNQQNSGQKDSKESEDSK